MWKQVILENINIQDKVYFISNLGRFKNSSGIIMDNYKVNDWNVISTEFDFVEPVKEVYTKSKIMILPQDVAFVTKQIETVYGKIMNQEFNTGCGKKDCSWCNFVKHNFEDATFEIPQQEEAED
jgi:DNA helicase-2/ATP-dependent DNA helicase PcrA